MGRASDLSAAPPPTILAIDDGLQARMLLRRGIANRNDKAKTLVVDTGIEGIEAARFYNPNVVVLDLQLPDINGRDVLRALKADPATATIPVVIVTGDANATTERELRDLGAADYVTKPYRIMDLADRVLNACRP
jgi:CheY-like chemotaxis protein